MLGKFLNLSGLLSCCVSLGSDWWFLVGSGKSGNECVIKRERWARVGTHPGARAGRKPRPLGRCWEAE